MKLVLMDTETTGLDVKEARVLELGYALWDTDRNCTLAAVNAYLHDATYPAVSEEITSITGITQDDMVQLSFDAKGELKAFNHFVAKHNASFIVAHNANAYDRPVMEANMKRYGLVLPEVPWIDTMEDLPFDNKISCRRLGHLAADHGFLNPFPHRALFDAMTMGVVLSRYPLEEIIKRQSSPSIVVRAMVSFEDNHKAKALRFQWEKIGDRVFTKSWVKRVKACDLEGLQSKADFKIARVA